MRQAAKVEYVTYPGEFVGLGFVVDDVGPFGVEGFAFGFVEGLVGVGAEEVALGLEEVGGAKRQSRLMLQRGAPVQRL